MTPSFVVTEEITITRQAGDTGQIWFILPDVIDPTGCDAQFQIRDRRDNLVCTMQTPDTITIDGLNVYVTLSVDDFPTKEGAFRYEAELWDDEKNITFAKGPFVVLRNISKR